MGPTGALWVGRGTFRSPLCIQPDAPLGPLLSVAHAPDVGLTSTQTSKEMGSVPIPRESQLRRGNSTSAEPCWALGQVSCPSRSAGAGFRASQSHRVLSLQLLPPYPGSCGGRISQSGAQRPAEGALRVCFLASEEVVFPLPGPIGPGLTFPRLILNSC